MVMTTTEMRVKGQITHRVLWISFALVLFALILVQTGTAITVNIERGPILAGGYFVVNVSANGPVNQNFYIKWNGVEHDFVISAETGEKFTRSISLKAPDSPGNYTLEYPGGNTTIRVVKPILTFTKFEVRGDLKKNSTIYVYYRVSDPSIYSAISLERRVNISPKAGYIFQPSKNLTAILNPGGSVNETIPIRIGPNASNANLTLTIEFVFDKTRHRIVKSFNITVENQNEVLWGYIILIGVIVAVIISYFWARVKKTKAGKKGQRKEPESSAFRGFKI